MAFKKKDFIEIEFTGKIKEGEIFDSNIKEDLKNANLNSEPKPFVFSLGEKMFLEGVDDFLIGKEIGEHEIELSPEKAFGPRDLSLVKIISMRVFKENKLNPVVGTMFNFDGRMAKIRSVSVGRVTIDFNNPLAGKTVVYKIKVLRKVDDLNEKAKALIEFFFKKDLDFEIKQEAEPLDSLSKSKTKGKKIIITAEKKLIEILKLFSEKFKDILGLELEVIEVKENKKEPEKENKKLQ